MTLAPHPKRTWRSVLRPTVPLPSRGEVVRESTDEALALIAAFQDAPDDEVGYARARAMLGQTALPEGQLG